MKVQNINIADILKKFEYNISLKNYNCLNKEESKLIRQYYISELEKKFNLSFDDFPKQYYLKVNNKKVLFLNNIDRFVIGDHGIYAEFISDYCELQLVIPELFNYKKIDSKYKNIKYLQYAPIYNNNILNFKIYFQLQRVDYADYLINKYYISALDLEI